MPTTFRNAPLAAAAIVAAAIILSGCSTGGPKAGTSQKSDRSTQTPTPTATGDQQDERAEDRNNLTFGSTYSYVTTADNTKYGDITVSAPRPYSPTTSAAGTVPGQPNVVVDVTFTNTSRASIVLGPQVTVLAGSAQGSEIFDSGSGLKDSPSNLTLTPGATVTWNAAFAVATTDGLQVQASPTYDAPPAIFH